jgi:hypothetical protein
MVRRRAPGTGPDAASVPQGAWGRASLRLGAFVVLAVWATGCKEEAPPVTVAKAYAAAAQRGDSTALVDLVDEEARAYLNAAAERASDQIGGRRNVEPREMVQITDVDPRFQVASTELLHDSSGTARVRLLGVDGSSHDVDLVEEDGRWRVRLPLPGRATTP